MAKKSELYVHLFDKPIGILTRDWDEQFYFRYHDYVKQPLSIAMPVKHRIFEHRQCRAFLSGLFPQDKNVMLQLAELYQIHPINTFNLLKKLGRDCFGAVSFSSNPDDAQEAVRHELDIEIVTPKMLNRFIEQAYEKPVIHQHYKHIYPYQHLATPICYINHEIALPFSGLSTHLLWVGKDERHFVQWNFWRGVAKKMGLRVPHCHLKRHGEYHYLIMERGDRKLTEHYQIVRLHQENLMQCLGMSSKLKFSKPLLHYLTHFFSICQKASVPALARNALMEQLILRTILEIDLYPRELSLIYGSHQTPIMGPCQNMRSPGGLPLENLDWVKLCKEIHFSYTALQRQIKAMEASLYQAIQSMQDEYRAQGFNLAELFETRPSPKF